MKLTYFSGHIPNFGDELNAFMWRHLLPPDFLDENENELFLGIGSILWDDLPKSSRKIVVGSGYGGYTPKPDVHDGSWQVLFVRGPRTASVLGLPDTAAISDAAIMLRAVPLPPPAENVGVAFMPHFESLDRGLWQDACRLAGIRMIDPTQSVEAILAQIRGARLLITEAMHGAIVADALRTPWIGVLPIHRQHHFKWHDWAESLNIPYRPEKITPSSVREVWSYSTGKNGQGRMSRLLGGKVAYPANLALTHMAARRLQQLATKEPQLSQDDVIEKKTDMALTALKDFVKSRTVAA